MTRGEDEDKFVDAHGRFLAGMNNTPGRSVRALPTAPHAALTSKGLGDPSLPIVVASTL